MGWEELVSRVREELVEELERISRETGNRKEKILSEGRRLADELSGTEKISSQKEAGFLAEEIISSGRIKARGIVRRARTDAVSGLYEEFRDMVLKDDKLRKEILQNFMKENIPAAEAVSGGKEDKMWIEMSPDAYALFKNDRKYGSHRIEKCKDLQSLVVLKSGNITFSFQWGEFMDRIREKTVMKLKLG